MRHAMKSSLFVLSLLLATITTSASGQAPSMFDPTGTQIVAGSAHSCALTTVGGVKCWGWNVDGQLGDGSTTTSSTVPVDVSGLGSGVVVIAAGGYHNCALTTTGAVQCWGNNDDGQLGNGSTKDSAVPVAVSGLGSGVVAITAGARHSCALTTIGAVHCWGENFYGQLGNGSSTDSSAPMAVSGLGSGVMAITAGRYHTCALSTAGAVHCWGGNHYGQLGDGSTTNSSVPVAVSGLGSGVVAIAAGEAHNCVLTTAGGAQCWGFNYFGQLGNGSTAHSAVPVNVTGLGSGAVELAAGRFHNCALSTAGTALCWGSNVNGQLGSGSSANTSVPVAVSGLGSSVAAIGAGGSHTCALTTVGGVMCWGWNEYGQLGNGSTLDRPVPGVVSGLASGANAITAGILHSCVLTTAGGAACWGDNRAGQLGNGSTTDSPVPVDVSGLGSGGVAIAAGEFQSCALNRAGAVQCWGDNDDGQLGNGSNLDSAVPVAVSGLGSGVAAITAGQAHTCAATSAGGVQCWGSNSDGQLGDGSTTDSSVPVAVSGLSGEVVAIAAGDYHSCALTTVGAVQCWGYNAGGQLGDGSTTDSVVPVAVSGLGGGAAAITAGRFHTCAVTTAGAVKCWGLNADGQLGDGSTASSSVPVAVSGLGSGVAAITAGQAHTCAVTSAGGVQCWGSNSSGQLGNGSTTDSPVPVDVSGLANGAAVVAAGGFHSCAVTAIGSVRCWGSDSHGQLGNASTTSRSVPVSILTGQSLNFAPPKVLAPGSTLGLSATASGGGTTEPITYGTWTPATCSISGSTLTALADNTLCGVRASREGSSDGANGTTATAPQQLRLIRVSESIFANGFDGPAP